VTEREAIALIDRLTTLPSETEWVEWKLNHVPPEDLGEYVSALANAACVRNERSAYLVFGIDNVTRKVVGTTFDPYAKKAVKNQDLLPWLAPLLSPSVRVEPTVVAHPGGRVVLFEISPARDTPVAFKGVPWIRVGTSKTKLARHPELERVIWHRSHDWSAEACPDATLDDLCPEAIRIARQQFAVKFPKQATECAAWDDVTFLNKARVLRRGEITNTAILLLGKPESASLIAPAVARISWILRDGDGKEQDYEHIGPPFHPGRRAASGQATQPRRQSVARRHPFSARDQTVRPLGDSRGAAQLYRPPGLRRPGSDHGCGSAGTVAFRERWHVHPRRRGNGDSAGCAAIALPKSISCRCDGSTEPH